MKEGVEYVAVVRVERVERSLVPKGTPVASSTRRVTTEERLIRDKSEVASFTVRASTQHMLRAMVRDVLNAALADPGVVGEDTEQPDDEEETF